MRVYICLRSPTTGAVKRVTMLKYSSVCVRSSIRSKFFLSSRRRHTRCSRDLEFRRVLFRSRFWRLFRPYRLRILPLLPRRSCRRPAIPQPDNAGAFRLDGPFLDSGTASLSDGWELMNMGMRSEEHTSELQSRLHLVCRLLLE